LAQEAFARALARWRSVSAMERPVAWVYVVAMNQARRDFRRDRRSLDLLPLTVTEDVAGSVATSVSLAAALATLAPRQRAVVVLRYLADLSTGEVAQALRCAEGTIKSTLHSALARLRVELEEQEQ
jgi:RNA polymerase sigma factor (sigma-70 family)